MTLDPEVLRAMLCLAFGAGVVASEVITWVVKVVLGWRR